MDPARLLTHGRHRPSPNLSPARYPTAYARNRSRPTHHLPSAIVFQTYGNEVDTVLIDGNIVMENRRLTWLTATEERALYRDAAERSAAISARAGIRRL